MLYFGRKKTIHCHDLLILLEKGNVTLSWEVPRKDGCTKPYPFGKIYGSTPVHVSPLFSCYLGMEYNLMDCVDIPYNLFLWKMLTIIHHKTLEPFSVKNVTNQTHLQRIRKKNMLKEGMLSLNFHPYDIIHWFYK